MFYRTPAFLDECKAFIIDDIRQWRLCHVESNDDDDFSRTISNDHFWTVMVISHSCYGSQMLICKHIWDDDKTEPAKFDSLSSLRDESMIETIRKKLADRYDYVSGVELIVNAHHKNSKCTVQR